MKRYLLDTSLLAAYLHNRTTAITLISSWIRRDEVATSILVQRIKSSFRALRFSIGLRSRIVYEHICGIQYLVYGEVIEYLKGLPNFQEKYKKLHTILYEIPTYPLTYAILEQYANIRRTLRPQHKDIGNIDTLIAATALEEHLTLVTIDRDFERVPKLKVQLVNLKAA